MPFQATMLKKKKFKRRPTEPNLEPTTGDTDANTNGEDGQKQSQIMDDSTQGTPSQNQSTNNQIHP